MRVQSSLPGAGSICASGYSECNKHAEIAAPIGYLFSVFDLHQ